MNGRIIIQPNTEDLFKMYDKIPVNQVTTVRNPLKGVWDENKLSKVFFSKENISIIQNGIRAGVYRMSRGKYLIDNQDSDQLLIIMRSTFIENSQNLPNNITDQVENLNNIIINYCSERVYNEAKGYLRYLKDASTIAPPLTYPTMTENKKHQLIFKSFFKIN